MVNGENRTDIAAGQDLSKRRLRFISNSVCLPLALVQAAGTVAVILGTILVILFRVSILHETGCFTLLNFANVMSQTDNSHFLNNITYALSYFSYMFIPLAVIAALLRKNPLKLLKNKIQNKNLIIPAVVAGLLFSVIGELYSGYFDFLLGKLHLKVQLDQFSFPDNVPALIIYALQISVLAPLCEEFIFRGLIIDSLRKYGNFFALLMSSIMFGLLHANFEQTPFAFIVGLALGFAVIETGSILVSILMHCAINSVSLIFSCISYYCTGAAANEVYSVYAVLVAAASIITLIYLVKNHFFKDIQGRYFSDKCSAPDALRTFAATPGFIIFAALYVVLMPASLVKI